MKRPVAFRYKDEKDAWILTSDESEAVRALDAGHDYQGLYVRDGTPLFPDWRSIETAPLGDDDFYLVCAVGDERSPFVVRGGIFATARKHPPQHHLSLAYLTHWMPLPEKPDVNSRRTPV
jgi:hypothetical protein